MHGRLMRGLCPRCLLRATLTEEEQLSRSDSPSADSERRFGDYKILRELGRGGMGVVYEARQLSLNRIVALKMLLPARLASTEELERFRFEAEGVAALDHPHILPVFEVGSCHGQPYFTMKLADGGSLAERLAPGPAITDSLPASPGSKSVSRNQYSVTAAAGLVATIARAVHYAHQRGIQHRDLKPGNILLDASGRPYVSDFGLAKFRDRDSGLTLSTTVLGSPAYMAPEQAAGDAKHVTVACDVYSLGAILYELLAGRPPFQGATALETMRQAVEQEPTPLRALKPGVDRDLDVICLKCLNKEPARRYASAEAFADELQRWLDGEPILARPISAGERLTRWCRRRPALTATLAALLFALLAGVTGVAMQWRRAEEHSRQRELERYAADMQVASQALANNDLGLARRTLAAEIPGAGESDLRGFEWRLLAKLCEGNQSLTITGHTATVTCVALSHDGGFVASGAMDGTVRLCDAKTGGLLTTFRHGSVVWSIDFTPDGERLISAGMDGKVRFWTRNGRSAEAPLEGQNASLSADGVRLAVSRSSPFKYFAASRGVTVWDWRQRKVLFQTNLPVRRVTLSQDGRWLAAAGAARDIYLWNIDNGESRRLPTKDTAWALAFSPDNQRLVAVGFGTGGRLWDLRSTNPPIALAGHEFKIWGVAFSPDGKRIVTTGSDRTVQIRHVEALDQTEVLVGHEDEIWWVAWSRDGERLATASKDMTARMWNANGTRDAYNVRNSHYWRPHFSKDGQRLLTANVAGEKRVTLFDRPDSSIAATFENRSVAGFAANGSDVVLLDEQNSRFERWVAASKTFAPAIPLQGVKKRIRARAFTMAPDATAMAIVETQDVFVWRIDDGALVAGPISLANGSAPVVALSPGARQLAVSLEAPYHIWLHDLGSGHVRVLTNHIEAVKGMAFSHDGRMLASAGLDRFIRLWNASDGSASGELVRYFEEATDVAFSPDGRLLASIGYEQSVNLWHLPTQREVLSLRMRDAAGRISFSPMGDALVFTTLSNTVRILSAPARGR